MSDISAYKKAITACKDALQDAVMLASKYKAHMGIIDQEELSRLNGIANGVRHNPADFDMSDRNGEQGL